MIIGQYNRFSNHVPHYKLDSRRSIKLESLPTVSHRWSPMAAIFWMPTALLMLFRLGKRTPIFHGLCIFSHVHIKNNCFALSDNAIPVHDTFVFSGLPIRAIVGIRPDPIMFVAINCENVKNSREFYQQLGFVEQVRNLFGTVCCFARFSHLIYAYFSFQYLILR